MATRQAAPTSFGRVLRRHRTAAGLTQEALAERAQLSVDAISSLERGTRQTPHQGTVELLADALQLSAEDRIAFMAAARSRSILPFPFPASRAQPVTSAPPLVGRARELALIERHLAGEGPPLLLVAGEPGIGKSRLLQATAERAIDCGWALVRGGCQRRSGQEPYAPLPEALHRLLASQSPELRRENLRGCAWLVRLVPELAEMADIPIPPQALAPEQERRLAFAAVGRLLAQVAGSGSPGGVLLLLDDLQWARTDALDLLDTLIRSAPEASGTRLRVVAAYRSTEVAPEAPLAGMIADLAQSNLATQLELGPLASDEAGRLLQALFAGAPDVAQIVEGALAARIVKHAGGLPFFLVTYAQSVRTSGDVDTVPWTVAQSIRQRVAALPGEARDLLGTAAVAGRVVAGELLVSALDLPEDSVLAAIAAACAARLLVEDGDEAYAFAHDLIQEVVEADLGAAKRRVLHRRLGEALERLPGQPPVERLAYHYAQGGERAKALPYLLQSGDRAEAIYAHDEAERQYRTAADLARALGDRPREAEALEKQGGALMERPRYDAALEVLEQAIAGYRLCGDIGGQARCLSLMVHLYSRKGIIEEELEQLLTRLETLAAAESVDQRGQVAVQLALTDLLLYSPRPDEELSAAQRALELVQTLGDQRQLAMATVQYGLALTDSRTPPLAVFPVIEEAARLCEAVGDQRTLQDALECLADMSWNVGEWARADQYIERKLDFAQPLGDSVSIADAHRQHAELAYRTGDWERARAEAERALALWPPEVMGWSLAYIPSLLGMIHLHQGNWETGTRWLEQAIAHATPRGGYDPVVYSQLVLAEYDLLAGRHTSTRARIESALARFGYRDYLRARGLPFLAWAALERGDLAEAETLAAHAVDELRTLGLRANLVEAGLRVRALVAIAQQRWDDAVDMLEETLSLCRAMPYPYPEAKALYVYGLLEIRRGHPTAARQRFEDALAICARLGERLYAGYIERALKEITTE
jgi:tetratricopeptide (TPR) repeat protein/transcriptional regulator with XRE-family HTH domain